MLPFQQRANSAPGYTQAILASSAGSAAVKVGSGSQVMFISNPSAVPVYLADGSSSIVASAPTTSTPAPGLCLPPGLAGTFGTDPNGWLSAATTSGTATIFATPGSGQ